MHPGSHRAAAAAAVPQFVQLLSKSCVRADNKRRVFLDVGANFGWYSVMAAKLGCR